RLEVEARASRCRAHDHGVFARAGLRRNNPPADGAPDTELGGDFESALLSWVHFGLPIRYDGAHESALHYDWATSLIPVALTGASGWRRAVLPALRVSVEKRVVGREGIGPSSTRFKAGNSPIELPPHGGRDPRKRVTASSLFIIHRFSSRTSPAAP